MPANDQGSLSDPGGPTRPCHRRERHIALTLGSWRVGPRRLCVHELRCKAVKERKPTLSQRAALRASIGGVMCRARPKDAWLARFPAKCIISMAGKHRTNGPPLRASGRMVTKLTLSRLPVHWRFDRFMATHARQVPPPVKKRHRNSMPHVARIEPRANSPRHRRHSAGQAPKRSARTMTTRWLPRAPRWVAGAQGGRLPDFTAREARLVVRCSRGARLVWRPRAQGGGQRRSCPPRPAVAPMATTAYVRAIARQAPPRAYSAHGTIQGHRGVPAMRCMHRGSRTVADTGCANSGETWRN